MDNALELLEQGRVGMTTAMGMGGVFLALLCLYGFTTALGKVLSPKPAKTQDKAAAIQAPAPAADAGTKLEDGNQALAAAVAVALAIQEDSQRILPLSVASGPPFGLSPWKIAGRRALMRAPAISATRKHQ